VLLVGSVVELDVTQLEDDGEEVPDFGLLGRCETDIFHGGLDLGEVLFVIDTGGGVAFASGEVIVRIWRF
jgi:hypothetical protein